MTRGLLPLVVLVGACAMPPKPRELTALEALRRHQHAESAVDLSPRFGKEADRLLRRAREAWEANDLDECRRDAVLGSIRLTTALSIFEQDRDQARLQALVQETEEATTEYQRLRGALAAVQEQVALLEQIREERASATEQRDRAAARRMIAEAELALRTADTVGARTHAPEEYAAAASSLERAKEALDGEDWAAATEVAASARERAESAREVATPIYAKEQESRQSKARDAALARKAAGLPGVSVRLEGDGVVTRLVLPLHGLFRRRGRAIHPDADAILDSVAALLREYPTYPVLVVGHTDSRGRRGELVALSQARAEATRAALVRRGAKAGRFAVSGAGPDEPVADNRTRSGRARNNRVEIAFLYR